ncbi:hypothetical protein IW261DRAFT_1595486 [Armillaria novae-zelandiae]|uniref:Uncharacterized protein n=1 Tax=Armillaria novae-zelandiae TaxID=153914 RepID=A0AA39P0X4_9AGAR|nr:hypothetical protein IW261DRAFT_1595486 [Armillaria novae-zelandiae]
MHRNIGIPPMRRKQQERLRRNTRAAAGAITTKLAVVGAVVVTTQTEGHVSDAVLVVHPGETYVGRAGFRFLREKRVSKVIMDADEEASDGEQTWGTTLGPALVVVVDTVAFWYLPSPHEDDTAPVPTTSHRRSNVQLESDTPVGRKMKDIDQKRLQVDEHAMPKVILQVGIVFVNSVILVILRLQLFFLRKLIIIWKHHNFEFNTPVTYNRKEVAHHAEKDRSWLVTLPVSASMFHLSVPSSHVIGQKNSEDGRMLARESLKMTWEETSDLGWVENPKEMILLIWLGSGSGSGSTGARSQ